MGLYDNEAMRRESEARLAARGGDKPGERYFVGFARPSYTGLLDPHEDVGFLIVHADRLEFLGERHDLVVDRSRIESIRFRRSIHSWVGLGRWVSIEGAIEGKPFRMLVEPREMGTLRANRRFGSRLRKRLQDWLAEDADPARRPDRKKGPGGSPPGHRVWRQS
ncbi:MAG: hypothetical protein SNJ76_05790 [Fimbriimonadaceae bacterium]